MKEYKIYTEDKHYLVVKQLCDERFVSYTVQEASGVWRKKSEPSIVITIIAPEIQSQRVYALARDIKKLNGQEAVLVTAKEVESSLI